MKTAFISPFSNPANSYIEIQKKILLECGYQIKPLTLKAIFSSQLPTLLSRNSTLIFHWIENRGFKQGTGGPTISASGLLIWAIYFLIAKFSRGESVYFIHNHAVHDTTGINKRLSKLLISSFSSACTKRVVHSPPLASLYSAKYLPHPLYWDTKTQHRHSAPTRNKKSEPLRFGIIGAIRPYKGIDNIISNWPKEAKLKLSGQCSAQYLKILNNLINKYNLADSISIDARFLSESDLINTLDETDALLLPHNPESIIVSGMFFEAIGKVPLIIARPNPFVEWAASQTKSVILLARDESLPEIIKQACTTHDGSEKLESNSFALREFGWRTCCERYQIFYTTNTSTRREHT